jgi:hypothetical protein
MATRMSRVVAVVAASGFCLSYRVWLFVVTFGLVPGDEYQLVILDSVGDGTCCGYGDWFAALYALWTMLTCSFTAGNSVTVTSATNSKGGAISKTALGAKSSPKYDDISAEMV